MRRRWNKIMALLLASAVLTANVGVVSTFAAGDEKTQQAAQNDESKEETDSEDKKQDDEKTTQTAAPTATVKEGTYSETQKITLKSSAKDAVIYYTTDGKEPTEKSTRFDAKKPIEVKKTTTIKAIAVSKETGKSKIATFTYKIGESDKKEESKETPAAEQTPSATPTTAPTEIPKQAQTSSEQGEAQLMPASAQEEKVGKTEISTATLNQDLAVGDSLISLNDKTKIGVVVEGDTFTVDAVNWEYKDDGTGEVVTQIVEGKTYTVSVTLKPMDADQYEFADKPDFSFNNTLIKSHSEKTAEGTVTYTFEISVPALGLTIKPDSTELESFADTKAEITYNTDKVTESDNLTLEYSLNDGTFESYNDAEKISLVDKAGLCKVTAKAVLNNISYPEVSKTYKEKQITVEKPTATPESGTVVKGTAVKLSTTTEGAEIFYTLDGTVPTKLSERYVAENGIIVDKDVTIRAVAYKGNVSSEVAVFTYKVETPAQKISKITISDLNRPKRGNTPDENATIYPKNQVSIKSIEWVKCNVKNGKVELEDEKVKGVFSAGTYYVAVIRLKTTSDYVLDKEALKDEKNLTVDLYKSAQLAVKFPTEKEMIIYTPAVKTDNAVTASPTNNTITGLSASYNKGATVTFTMNGAGADNPSEEGNERYVPVKYKIGNSEFKFEDNQNPKLAKSFTISTAGTYTLTVTFQKQVYDAGSSAWKNVDGVTDTKTATVKINATTTSTGTLSKTGTASKTTTTTTSTTSKAKNAKTGDETPVGAVVTVFVLAGAAVVVLIARKRKSQK